jgi:hypothetical protein
MVPRQKWSRGQIEARFANMSPCLIGMEASIKSYGELELKETHRDASGRNASFRTSGSQT